MKNQSITLTLLCLLLSCEAKEKIKPNNSPSANLEAKLLKVNPYTFEFTVKATDPEFDALNYTWDFGDGTKKIGKITETASFVENKKVTITVSVSDGFSAPTLAKIEINPESQTVTIDDSKTFQTIEGFGGFGAQDVYWSGGPFTSPRFVNDLVNDLGVTIIREDVPTSFEIENDNNDPLITDLSKYNLYKNIDGHHATFGQRIPHLKALYAAGVTKFVASVWSPAPWMKWNNDIDNGTSANAAPAYNKNPNSSSNQLKVENYEEFAEMLVAYIRIFKREIGIDLYGIGVQNEPRFSQSYQSCVYDGNALRALIKVVGKRFEKEGLKTKIFAPEDVGWLDGAKGMTLPMLNDSDSRKYIGAVATHGYAFDGINPSSTDAQAWKTMYSWGAEYNLPHWMTETSGFKNTHEGAVDLAKAMYTAFKYGNVSAWIFWSLSTQKLDEFSLLSSSGEKSKRYYFSKHFYKYIKPGAVRIETKDSGEVLSLAFKNNNNYSVVLINVGEGDKVVKIEGGAVSYKVVKSGLDENTITSDDVKKGGLVIVPAKGITTLYSTQ